MKSKLFYRSLIQLEQIKRINKLSVDQTHRENKGKASKKMSIRERRRKKEFCERKKKKEEREGECET